MNVGKRAFLYLTRKKGKNLLLGIVFLLISFSLLTGSVVYLGIRQVSEDLRSNIGASFNIIPYEQFDMNNGQVSSKGTPVIDEQSIRRVISIVGKDLKCYNTEHSGYVKGENLSFLAGTGHSEESNMGTVKAVRDSSLCQAFWMRNTNWQRGNISDQRTTVKFLSVKPLPNKTILLLEIR